MSRSRIPPVLAIDLGGTKVAAAVVDASGIVRERVHEAVDRASARAPIDQMARLANALADPVTPRTAFTAAGVAVPGLVRRTGSVWAPNLGWARVPAARLLAQRLALPVAVESDRNTAVLGEAWRGAARGRADVVTLIVGTGIGAGILSGGRIVRGAHELSGCAGWQVVSDRRDPRSAAVGCLEAVAAGPAIADATDRAIAAGEASVLQERGDRAGVALTARDVAEAARAGDALARRVFEMAGRELGFAVANLISLFDPEVVVVGGGLAEAADLFLDTLRRTALASCQPIAARHVRIAVSRLGGRANLLGAARVALDMIGRP